MQAARCMSSLGGAAAGGLARRWRWAAKHTGEVAGGLAQWQWWSVRLSGLWGRRRESWCGGRQQGSRDHRRGGGRTGVAAGGEALQTMGEVMGGLAWWQEAARLAGPQGRLVRGGGEAAGRSRPQGESAYYGPERLMGRKIQYLFGNYIMILRISILALTFLPHCLPG